MNTQELLEAIGERISAGTSVRAVYAEPVVRGNRTVIPAAEIRYGFGGGGRPKPDETGGFGAGARVSARPWGAIEITPDGTRFISAANRRATGIAFALGLLLGAAAVALAGSRRIEVVKKP